MTGPIRGFATIVGLAGLACALTACGSSVGGNPTAVSPSRSAPSSSPSSQTDTPLAGMSPCKTLDQALAGQGYPHASPSIADQKTACDTQKFRQAHLSLGLQDGQSYDTSIPNPANATTGNVRARRAILEPEPTQQAGSCAVSIEAKPKSRATVFAALTSGNTDDACLRARLVAEGVERLLPKNT
ncbi:hypothetical protein AB0K15_14835 [Amycolatopsis sp. NPDC049253]|uniref:hypothetical protein n=1 Tax=Amycolatopsis sp. NPDC049253 TaxID=3155274 RepID=UPI003441003C